MAIPRRFKGGAAATIVAGAAAIGVGKELFGNHNANALGRVSYGAGPARMTQAYGTDAVATMMQASNGNYGAFSDMAEEVVRSHGNVFGHIDDYGADAKMISALYNMGG